MIVRTDPVIEAIAKKLFGFAQCPPTEQAKMIHRAAVVAQEVARAEYLAQVESLNRANANDRASFARELETKCEGCRKLRNLKKAARTQDAARWDEQDKIRRARV